jgi:hypothetical protein
MKRVLVFAPALMGLIVAASKVLAQAPPPSVPSAMSPSTSRYVTAPASPSIIGTVKQYLLTPVGDVEGLELQDGY